MRSRGAFKGVSWAWKWVIVKLVFLRKLDAEPTKEIKSYGAITPTKEHTTCIILRLEKENEVEMWNRCTLVVLM